MKKLSFLLLMFFMGTTYLNAECSYKDIKELNTLASYINTSYDYVEESKTFNLTYYNLTDRMAIDYYGIHEAVNGSVVLTNLSGGTMVKSMAIIKSGDECYGQELRTININIPYVNEFYNRSECANHMDLSACSSKFLDYKLTESTFLSLINRSEEERKISDNNDEKSEDIVEETFFDKALDIVKEYYIPAILVIVSSIITYVVFNSILRKIKHGL